VETLPVHDDDDDSDELQKQSQYKYRMQIKQKKGFKYNCFFHLFVTYKFSTA